MPLGRCRWLECGKVVCRARHAVPLLSEKPTAKARPEASGSKATADAALKLRRLVAG